MVDIKLEFVKTELEQMERYQDWLIKKHPEFKDTIRGNEEDIAFYKKLVIRLEKKLKKKSKPKQLELVV